MPQHRLDNHQQLTYHLDNLMHKLVRVSHAGSMRVARVQVRVVDEGSDGGEVLAACVSEGFGELFVGGAGGKGGAREGCGGGEG